MILALDQWTDDHEEELASLIANQEILGLNQQARLSYLLSEKRKNNLHTDNVRDLVGILRNTLGLLEQGQNDRAKDMIKQGLIIYDETI